MHDVFSNWDRRAILYFLDERDDPAPVDSVAAHVVAWRRGDDSPAQEGGALSDDVIHDIRMHAMQMDEFGVLSFDPDEGILELADDVQISVSPPWLDREEPATTDLTPTLALGTRAQHLD